MSSDSIENKRKLFRVYFHTPIWGQMKIVAINNQPVKTNYAKVLIIDLSAGGARIHTKLYLPSRDSMTLEVKFTILDNEFRIKGNIVRKKLNLENMVVDYGIQFNLDDENQENLLISMINKLSVRLKNKSLNHADFCDPQEVIDFYIKK
jgi:c-di-GMP-binding flagellar brake protein YcgR